MIVLDDNYRIRRMDRYNIVIEEKIEAGKVGPGGKIGKGSWKIIGYFGKIVDAFYYVINRIDINGVESIEEAMDEMRKMKTEMSEQIEEAMSALTNGF